MSQDRDRFWTGPDRSCTNTVQNLRSSHCSMSPFEQSRADPDQDRFGTCPATGGGDPPLTNHRHHSPPPLIMSGGGDHHHHHQPPPPTVVVIHRYQPPLDTTVVGNPPMLRQALTPFRCATTRPPACGASTVAPPLYTGTVQYCIRAEPSRTHDGSTMA